MLYSYLCGLRRSRAPATRATSLLLAWALAIHVVGFDDQSQANSSLRCHGSAHRQFMTKKQLTRRDTILMCLVWLPEVAASVGSLDLRFKKSASASQNCDAEDENEPNTNEDDFESSSEEALPQTEAECDVSELETEKCYSYCDECTGVLTHCQFQIESKTGAHTGAGYGLSCRCLGHSFVTTAAEEAKTPTTGELFDPIRPCFQCGRPTAEVCGVPLPPPAVGTCMVPYCADCTGQCRCGAIHVCELSSLVDDDVKTLDSDILTDLGSQSMKATWLTAMGNAGVEVHTRQLLGYHVVKGESSVLDYNRDNLAAPMEAST
jgi:hypothetical protein